LYDTELTVDRLKVIAAKMVNDVAQLKRRGHKVVGDLMKGIIYNKGKLSFFKSIIVYLKIQYSVNMTKCKRLIFLYVFFF